MGRGEGAGGRGGRGRVGARGGREARSHRCSRCKKWWVTPDQNQINHATKRRQKKKENKNAHEYEKKKWKMECDGDEVYDKKIGDREQKMEDVTTKERNDDVSISVFVPASARLWMILKKEKDKGFKPWWPNTVFYSHWQKWTKRQGLWTMVTIYIILQPLTAKYLWIWYHECLIGRSFGLYPIYV